jgi:hypothetical protein
MPDDDLNVDDFETKFGFPRGTAIADMNDKQQIAYWKYYSRLHEKDLNELRNSSTKVPDDYVDLQKKAKAYEDHLAETATEQEKAVKAAADEAYARGLQEASSAAGEKLVRMAIKAAGASLTPEQQTALAGSVNASSFLTADGSPDEEKITALVGVFAGSGGNGQQNQSQDSGAGAGNSLGQGKQGVVQTDPMADGAAMALKMFGPPPGTGS